MSSREDRSLKTHPPRTSELLAAIAATHAGERLGVGELVHGLRNRAFGMTLLLFGIPNCIPLPPGVPIVCGIVLAFIGLQLAAGRDEPWLPRRIAERRLPAAVLTGIVERALPWVRRFERLSRPRLPALAGPVARRLIGVMVVVLAGVLILPIPFLGNMPPGIAICIFGLGLVERDGLLVGLGVLASLVGLGVTVGATWVVLAGAASFF